MQAGLPMGSARCATIRPREMQSRANLARESIAPMNAYGGHAMRRARGRARSAPAFSILVGLGGPHTFTVAWTSSQFRDKNTP